MAHYAFLDSDNIVTHIIVGVDEETNETDWETHYGGFVGQTCKRTSYNTIAGEHKSGGTPFRKNYAGVGHIYDAERNAFYIKKPYPSWTLNEQSCCWEPPIPRPIGDNGYVWIEKTQSWESNI